MLYNVLRVIRCFYQSQHACSVLTIAHSLRQSGIFSTMREVNIKGASGLCTLVSDGQSEIPQSVSDSENMGKSFFSVQSTPEIEKKYVHHVYDAIAPHFSSTRFAKWPKVATFLSSLPSGSLVLDAGCGNDAINLPYRTDFGDAAISIAVLHHLSTEIRRKRAIEELVRVVKKGGLVLITVWAVEQEDRSLLAKWTPLSEKYVEEWIGPGSPLARSPSSLPLESIPENEDNGSRDHIEDSMEKMHETPHLTSESKYDSLSLKHEKNTKNQQEYFVPWHLPYHRAEVSGASACALANGLAKKDDKKGAVVYNRYYHVFSEGELERLASGIDNAVIVDQFYDKSNWCIILEKIL